MWRPLLVALAVAGFIVLVVLFVRTPSSERGALLDMDDVERKSLYDEERRNAETLCAHAKRHSALAGRCEDSAQFLLAFPECDDTCRDFARAHRPEATR